MNILFVHSHILRKKENNYYSTGGISAEILERYLLDDTDILYTYNREKICINDEKLVKVNGDRIICNPSKIYHEPKDYYFNKKKLLEEINERLKGIDFCIIREPDLLSETVYRQAKKQNIPCIIEMAGSAKDALWYYGNLAGKLLSFIRHYQVKKVVKDADRVIYVSNEFLQKKYPTKGKNIGCSNVNIELIDNKVLDKRIKKIEDMTKNIGYKIGLIGSLDVNYKGHKTAIKAISKLRNRYYIELHFLGAGDNTRWKKLAKKYNVIDRVFFDGTRPNGNPVYEWLDSLDIFLMPSLTEGLPRSLIEAMSRGCPCIGTKVGGIPELIDSKYIIMKKDYFKLAIKIDMLLSQKEKMKEQSYKNFEKAKEYNKNILNKRRKEFFIEFRKSAKEKI